MLLQDKLNIDFDEDWDAWESKYEDNKYEVILNLQINTLSELFGDFERGIAEMIIDSVMDAVAEQDDSDIVFFEEVKYALRNFIIVDKYSDEDKKCVEKLKEGELHRCKFEDYELSNYSLYYII